MNRTRTVAILSLLMVAGCDEPTGPELDFDDIPAGLSPTGHAGAVAFRQSCATCHASRDGFDLGYFGYTDARIIARALGHVSEPTAEDIVAYIRELEIAPVPRDTRLYQPGSEPLASDRDMAVQAFGQDQWPLDLTPDELLAMPPRSLPIGLPLLEWSVEGSEQDWLPDLPLPEELLDERSGALRTALREHYLDRSMSSLLDVLALFDELSRGDEDSGRVCAGDVAGHPDADACFNARRWMASLAAQHLLREGIDEVPLPVLDLWWDVGEAAVTQSLDRVGRSTRQSAYESSAKWLYTAWLLDPVREDDNPLYFAEQLFHSGYPRLAGYAALYSMVVKPEGWEGGRPYIFHLQTFLRMPDHWTYNVVLWGYRVIQGYIDQGIIPTGHGLERAEFALDIGEIYINEPGQDGEPRLWMLTDAQRDTLNAAIAEIRDALGL